jgi:hypothetical protein
MKQESRIKKNIVENDSWDVTPVHDNEKQQSSLLPIYSCEWCDLKV